MDTEILSIDPTAPGGEPLARAAAVLRQGGLVAFPTETVYGLGANALDANAVARIYEAKGRPARNPVIVHVAAVAEARALAAAWPPTADELARRFWPGPLTLVLPRGGGIPDIVSAGAPTVAIRIPSHPVALALLREAGLPLAAPSANRSTELSPTTARHVLRSLGGRIALILDAGPTPGGIESTVLDLTTSPPRLLRPGLVSLCELEEVLGPVGRHTGADAGAPLPSPGLMTRHYAPRTPLVACDGSDAARERVEAEVRRDRLLVWLCFGSPEAAPAGVQVITLPGEPTAAAVRLYALLHDLDEAGLDTIVVTLPPDDPGWLAVRDRLLRAGG